ncbi:hypothetical protein [Furfurilactobacillus siliginis]|uniref:Uncharacterized protein n=1 Tax=Furfurilactobacillus siliginis TaxID=348151 RepID=A0A0R2L3M5_9LACO|nr:hypothetical protein [Furfurilactobacillus siliginis]KRN94108.1 hypothetical protein IV55_GL000621 [Furfurilactobacillus siliginis]GEK29088.1 hypothetical protein LSI01_13990 [Furfurilactobacillus siliginis]
MVEKNIILAEFFNGKPDVLHDQQNINADINAIAKTLVQSAERFDLSVHLLTDADFISKMPNLIMHKVDLFQHYPDISLYMERLEPTFDFLMAHPEVEKAALVDVGDVELLNYPFDEIEADKLYIGNENGTVGSVPIVTSGPMPQYAQEFFLQHMNVPLVNPGVIVGTRAVLLEFIGKIATLIAKSQLELAQDKPDASLGVYEMMIVNYVAYRYFAERMVQGLKVNSTFQFYNHNVSSWFRHK